MRARRLAAGWVIPIEGAPIHQGAILIGSDGRLQAIGADSDVPRPADVPAVEFDDCIILPGLINTHTHLELTGFEGRVLERDFPAWIRRLRQVKASRTAHEYVDAARRGLSSCYASGVTTVADTGDSGAVALALSQVDGAGIAYQEVFGPHPDQAGESLAAVRARISELRRLETDRLRIGISPHAAYSVSGRLFAAAAAWAEAEGLPLAVHVAESAAETQFLLADSGPFADAWIARGIPLPHAGVTPVAWLEKHGVLGRRTLCIHAVEISAAEIQRLADTGSAVAHCPLSNRAHGHDVAPLHALLNAGVRVGLGTDSVVSVGRLDLIAEARAAAEAASLNADQVLELCTLAGARALGLDADTGSLRVGKWADCVVVRSPAAAGSAAERVLASSPDHILRTYLGGREVYRSL